MREAKVKGETVVTLPEPNVYPVQVNNLDEVFVNMIVFVGTLERKQSDFVEGIFETWALFHIDEDLSRHPISRQVAQPPQEWQTVLPNGMFPLKKDQFIVSMNGGSVFVDGVELRSGQLPLALHAGQQYVFMVSAISPPTTADYHTGLVRTGTQGAFRVGPNSHLEPVVPTEGSVIQISVHNYLGDHLDLLRRKAAER